MLRSLKTLHLRVPRQSESATALAQWLYQISVTPAGQQYDGVPGGIVSQVWHSSLQKVDERGFDPKTQMEGGFNATFSFLVCASNVSASDIANPGCYFRPRRSLKLSSSLISCTISWYGP